MKRWFLLAVATAALPVIALACGDDDPKIAAPGVDAGPTATTTTTSTATGTTTSQPSDAGPDATPKRTGCVDRPTDVERPDRLPCNLIPPGVSL